MKLLPLLPKFNKFSKLINVENIIKNSQWRNWNLRDLLLVKKWRDFLNLKTVELSHRDRRNIPFEDEEILLITENRFGGASRLIKLVIGSETKLKTRNGKVNSLEHNLVIGKNNGDVLKLKDIPYRLQRVSLADYVLHMKRVATPSYPKDIQVMLSMADVRQGSFVLEAGSGSGALTLYLSSAVGKEGQVHSFDYNEKHIKRAKENVYNWTDSWNKTNYPPWPENVVFYNASLKTFRETLPAAIEIDTILLDLQSPENYLEFLISILKQECPVVIFLPSITQVVDVVSYCNKNKLPFDLDKVVEVNHRLWKIQAVMPVDRDLEQKHEEHVVDAENTGGEMMLQVKYAAKPSFQQLPHTGFILKLVHRK